MSTSAILQEMADLIRSQIEAVVAGDHEAVLAGAVRHEELLAALPDSEMDLSPEELRNQMATLDQEKTRLKSLLETEAIRVDFLLRLILGGGQSKQPVGYPGSGQRNDPASSRLNRRA